MSSLAKNVSAARGAACDYMMQCQVNNIEHYIVEEVTRNPLATFVMIKPVANIDVLNYMAATKWKDVVTHVTLVGDKFMIHLKAPLLEQSMFALKNASFHDGVVEMLVSVTGEHTSANVCKSLSVIVSSKNQDEVNTALKRIIDHRIDPLPLIRILSSTHYFKSVLLNEISRQLERNFIN